MATKGVAGEFFKGFWDQNPTLRLILGMCPTLAVTTNAENGVGMGIATTFVLVSSNLMVSVLRKLIPNRVRIAAFIVLIASFVTVVDLVIAGFFPALHKALGIFIPLIVVNCIILGRAETFASRNPAFWSVVDGLGMGLGFTTTLFLVGSIRELLGNGTILGHVVLGPWYTPVILLILPPGAFITLGLIAAGMSKINQRLGR